MTRSCAHTGCKIMPLLWAPNWTVGARFSLRRSYATVLVVGWNQCHIVSSGRTTVLQEEIFGGYRFHLTIKTHPWDWTSSSYPLEEIFEDVFVTPPESSIPISAGPVTVRYGLIPQLMNYGIILDMAGINHMYWAQEMPAAPNDYWLPPMPQLPPMPYPYIA
jgi:hypothetical protein